MVKGRYFIVLGVISAISTRILAAELLDISLSTDFFSRYIWRGQSLGHKAVIQPNVTLGKDGFSCPVR